MRYLKYITGVVAGIALVGCSSFLEENPDQRTTIDSPEKIKQLLVYAYPSANNFYALEAMTDNFGDSRRTANTALDNTAYYSWKDETQESWDSPSEFWDAAYKAISQANQALESVETVQMTKEMYEGIKGEALLARAYAHWMLANTFCEAYDPNTAASKQGIPYVDEVEEELIKEYKRGTLADVYARLEADIVEGVRLAKDEAFFSPNPSFHFTKGAGSALAARFFAHKGDWDKVLEYTNVFGDKATNLRDIRTYAGVFPNAQGQLYGDQKEKANLLIVGSRSLLRRYYSSIRFGMVRPILSDMMSKYNPYGRSYAYEMSYWASQDVYFQPKFHEYFVYENQGAGTGMPYVNVPLLTVDEAFLYRIEAKIMKDQYDEAANMIGYFAKFKTAGNLNESTVTLANVLRGVPTADEYKPFYQMNDTQSRLMKYVSELRRREFVHMGYRWFDIKRFNLEVVHTFDIEGTRDVLTAQDKRKAIQLPQSALGAGLTPNER